MIRHRAGCRIGEILVSTVLVAVACNSTTAENGDERITSSPDVTEDTAAVARSEDDPPEFASWEATINEGDGAQALGDLRIDGSCIYVESVFDGSQLLVLPAVHTTVDFDAGTITLDGNLVWDGDRVAAGGGEASLPEDGWPDCEPVARFFAHSLSAAIDGNLDCVADHEGRFEEIRLLAPDAPGLPPEEALEEGLRTYSPGPEGEIVFIEDKVASIVVGGREQVIAVARRVGANGYVVERVSGCYDSK